MPDAGPLITLAYAGRLDLLLRPGWPLRLVDMVLHELTRNATPTRQAIQAFVAEHRPTLVTTATFLQLQAQQPRAPNAPPGPPVRNAGLGELALQEAINNLALAQPPQPVILLFEDHKIARLHFIYRQVHNGCQRERFCGFCKRRAGLIRLRKWSDRQ